MTEDLVKVAQDSARGSFFLISGTALATVILAIGTITVTNLLGPEQYGEYVLALTIPSLLVLFTDLGINLGITKFTATLNAKGETRRVKRIIQISLLLKAIVGTALFLVSYMFADQFAALQSRPELAFYIRVGSFSILFQAIFATAASAFVGLDKTEYQAITTNIQATAKTALSIALVLAGYGVVGATLGYTTSNLAGAISGTALLFLILRRKQGLDKGYQFRDEIGNLMRYGLPLYISLLFTSFIPPYQNLILGQFVATAEVGNYKAAANFGTLLATISIPISTMLLPAFAKLDSSTEGKIKTFFKLANKYTTALIIPLMALLIVFSSEIIKIVYGPTFQTAPMYLALYCLIYLLLGIGYLTLSCFYNGLGQTATTLRINVIAFVTILFLSPVATMFYGVAGLIAAWLTGTTAGNIYSVYVAKKRFKLDFDTGSLIKIYLVSAMSVIPTLLVFTTIKLYINPGIASFLTSTSLPTMIKSAPIPEFFNVLVCSIVYLSAYLTLIAATRAITEVELQTATHVTERTPILRTVAKPIIAYEQRILRKRTKARVSESSI